VSLPAGVADGCPVGLSLIGAPGADEMLQMLLNLAAAISVYCG
jgi:Asp-tRNA(Asn)/Glu-tRNA(Gln) amidotransferase A subunit family amidase